MKNLMGVVFALIAAGMLASCATSEVKKGQTLFAGCEDKVDDKETLRTGMFVCKGDRDPAPFSGNGRSCGDCHMPGENFGLSSKRIAALSDNHPLFFSGLDEDADLLRTHGLIRVIVPGEIDEFRQSPKLNHLQSMCDEDGTCTSLGLLGDRSPNLCVFSTQAIANHMSKTVDRTPGTDFRVPSQAECAALVAYMLSDLVAVQD